VTDADRAHWDGRYAPRDPVPVDAVAPPEPLARYEHLVPTVGTALDVACGQGVGAVWLARRGLAVEGLDVSAVAVERARDLARRSAVDDRCRFHVVDLDHGLPPGPPVDLVVCLRFRDPRLDPALVDRLRPGGLLVVTALSEVGARPGRFRVGPGELPAAFSALDLIAAGEGDGEAWLLARK
jgi:SAM-dependent methyltransferase